MVSPLHKGKIARRTVRIQLRGKHLRNAETAKESEAIEAMTTTSKTTSPFCLQRRSLNPATHHEEQSV